MVRLSSSRTFGIIVCILATIGVVLSVILLYRGRDLGQPLMFLVMELGLLSAGVGIIRRAAQFERHCRPVE